MVIITKTLDDSNRANDFIKTAEEFFSSYKKHGLMYSIMSQGRKVRIILDMSDDKLLSNLTWAIISSLYRFKD